MIPKDSEEEYNSEEKQEPDQEEPTGDLEQTLAEEKKKAEEYLANWQRTQADFVNYKRRTEQERQDLNRWANANLLLNFLPVLDDLERALDVMPPRLTKNEWSEGMKLVERKFKTILEGQGVTAINALGETFDPNFHEALRQDKGPDGIVIEEFQKGYLLGDKVLRPALVIVGNGEEEEKEDNNNG